jgi:hypothetical protein
MSDNDLAILDERRALLASLKHGDIVVSVHPEEHIRVVYVIDEVRESGGIIGLGVSMQLDGVLPYHITIGSSLNVAFLAQWPVLVLRHDEAGK